MPKRDYRSLWITLFCVNLINSTQAAIAVVGIPSHAIAQGLNDHQLALLLSVFPIAAGVAALLSGTISDLLGRRTTLITGLLILSLSLSLHALALDFQTLLVLRGLSGLATGALTGLPSTLLSDNLPQGKQIQATAKSLSGHALGQTLGIPTGIALLELVSFPQLCFGLGLISLLFTLLLRLRLPTNNPSKYYQKGEFPTYIKGALKTLGNRTFAALAFTSYISFTALSLFYVTFALWLFRNAQAGPSEIAPMHLFGGGVQVVVLLFVLQRLSSIGPARTIALSLILNSVLFAIAYYTLHDLLSATVILALTLGAVALRIPSFQFLVNNQGSESQKGLRMSIVQTGNHLGKATGYILASYLFEHMEVHQIVLLCGILTLFCGLIFHLPLAGKVFAPPLKADHPRVRKTVIGDPTERNRKARLWHVRC